MTSMASTKHLLFAVHICISLLIFKKTKATVEQFGAYNDICDSSMDTR